ncbi:MAG: hypothetical protein K9M54_09320, partial [Kiritimatiellales bacterium]|nr:hypothetical protein [Kiritimatiellales bacterium]
VHAQREAVSSLGAAIGDIKAENGQGVLYDQATTCRGHLSKSANHKILSISSCSAFSVGNGALLELRMAIFFGSFFLCKNPPWLPNPSFDLYLNLRLGRPLSDG